MTTSGNILLFDGDCNLCDSFVNFIIRHDTSQKIKFSPLQSENGQSILKRYGHHEDSLKAVVYIREEKYYNRSSAVLNILRDTGGVWCLFYGFVLIPKFIRDFLYSIVAGLRYRIFGRTVSCIVTYPAAEY